MMRTRMADNGTVAAESVLVQGNHQRAVLLEGQHILEQQGPVLGQIGRKRNSAVQE
jgi:translation initiation factor 1 (eIF-1/SUI1)